MSLIFYGWSGLVAVAAAPTVHAVLQWLLLLLLLLLLRMNVIATL